MSMSNYANRAIVVNENFVKETCKEEFKVFMSRLEEEKMSLEELAQNILYDDGVNSEGELWKAYVAVCEKFGEKTLLPLFLDYHEAEETGDEVDGAFWALSEEDVYVLTPSAKAIEGKFEVVNFVTWG